MIAPRARIFAFVRVRAATVVRHDIAQHQLLTVAQPGGAAMISVLIVERDPAIRWQVAGAIAPEPELALFGAVGTAVGGARLALSYLPNVLLVGTTLPDALGLAAVKALRKLLPETVLGVITADENGEEVA